jgi:hypothetical protein
MSLKFRNIILIAFTLLVSFSLYGQEDQSKDASLDNPEKPRILLLSLMDDKVPSYITKVVDKVLEKKIEETGIYTVINQETINSILISQNYPIPEKNDQESALLLGLLVETDQIMFGTIELDGDDYVIKSTIVESASEEVLFAGTEKASSLKEIEPALNQMTKDLVNKIFPPAVVENVIETMEATAIEKVQTDGNLEDFSELAVKDPEKALELVDEVAREAITETIREKVIEEELEDLFAKEKASLALEKKRKTQFWTMFSLEGINQLGNISGSLAAYMSSSSLMSWSNYMNDNFQNDPYRQYLDAFQGYQGLQGVNYIFSTGGNIGLTLSHGLFLEDVYSFSKAGRHVYAISSFLNVAGNAASVYANTLTFNAVHKYAEYSAATIDFTTKYESYRTAFETTYLGTYLKYGLWGTGLAGMLTASFLPGEKTPMTVSRQARNLMTWGGVILSLGNLSSGLSLDYLGRAETAWINENAKSGWIGPSLYSDLKQTSDILIYSSYGLIGIGGILTYLSLILPPGGDGDMKKTEEDNLSFSLVPDMAGFSALVRVRY